MMRMEVNGGDQVGDEVVSAAANRLIFAYYVTGHGFGHATRVTEVHFVFGLLDRVVFFGF